MLAAHLHQVLEGTGYLLGGEPAPGVRLGDTAARSVGREGAFWPDATWQGPSGLRVYFKGADGPPPPATTSSWHRAVWNEGFAPLLWVVCPDRVDLYNSFGRPQSADDAHQHRIRVFDRISEGLDELDAFAGRLAMETGQFWSHSEEVTRKSGVDEQLLVDLQTLEEDLVGLLPAHDAHALIGRSIFTQYLVDRQILDSQRLVEACGAPTFPMALRDPGSAHRLFDWLTNVFDGDMFPGARRKQDTPDEAFARVADFLEAVDPETGQTTFFPYQFDVIPVELISSIYEQFVHSKKSRSASAGDSRGQARRSGVHYTRLPVVSLILDEVLQDASGTETVLDLTCGSGVFLVEAFRRLVRRKAGQRPSREDIRNVLHTQVFGVDISEAAVRIAAFSLYLAALELDPEPEPPEALRFDRLIGDTLFVADAFGLEESSSAKAFFGENGTPRKFDVIVGNPPWTFRGRVGTTERLGRGGSGVPRQPRGEGFDFLLRAAEFGDDTTRYGVVLSAMPFFSGSSTGVAAARAVVAQLSPVTLVNLSALTSWLFPTAAMPAIVLLARHRPQPTGRVTTVNVPWSPLAEKSYTFEVAPSDVSTLSESAWSSDRDRLKATMFGRGRDLPLLDELRRRHPTLSAWLKGVGTQWRDGLILGRPERRTRDARFLQGLEVVEAGDLSHFRVPSALPRFSDEKAQWPRSPGVYQAPLLLIKEFFRGGPRAITAVAERNLCFKDAYFGASLPKEKVRSGWLIAAILSSALGSWFFYLTASEFGLWKRRLLTSDVGRLPLVDPDSMLRSAAARRLLKMVQDFRDPPISESEWHVLDESVFDLYELSEPERMVVRDGLERASWEWKKGRKRSASPAGVDSDLATYALSFAGAIDRWLQASGQRHISAEVIDVPQEAAIRIVRFVLSEGRRDPTIVHVSAEGRVADVLRSIEERLEVPVGTSLTGERELRIHGVDEVVIIKPSAVRFWLPSVGLSDADAVVRESFSESRA